MTSSAEKCQNEFIRCQKSASLLWPFFVRPSSLITGLCHHLITTDNNWCWSLRGRSVLCSCVKGPLKIPKQLWNNEVMDYWPLDKLVDYTDNSNRDSMVRKLFKPHKIAINGSDAFTCTRILQKVRFTSFILFVCLFVCLQVWSCSARRAFI